MNKFHSIFLSFPFERRFEAGYTWAPKLPKDLESRCQSNQPTSIELSLSYPLAFPPDCKDEVLAVLATEMGDCALDTSEMLWIVLS